MIKCNLGELEIKGSDDILFGEFCIVLANLLEKANKGDFKAVNNGSEFMLLALNAVIKDVEDEK